MARDHQIIYGTLTTGGSQDGTYTIDGKPVLSYSTPLDAIHTATLSWRVMVRGATEAAFKTLCDAVEAEFKQRFLRLRWIIGSTTFLDFNPSTDSGFNAEPSAEAGDEIADTARSRIYKCSVTVQLPAGDNTGRVASTVSVSYDASRRRTVTISGRYTAQSGTAARANYASKIGSFVSGILSGLGGTYESDPSAETVDTDDQDKVCDFSRSYVEILYDQSAAGADHTSIINHVVTFASERNESGDTPGGQFGDARRFININAAYACNVDFGGTTDLQSLWTGTLRPYILSEAKRIFNASAAWCLVDAPSLNASANTISAYLRIQAVVSGATVYEYNVEQTREEPTGAIIRGVWDGDANSAHVYEGKAFTKRTTVISALLPSIRGIEKVMGVRLAAGEADKDGRTTAPKKDGWVRIVGRPSYSPIRMGIPGLGTKDVTQFRQSIEEVWLRAPGSGGPVITPHGTDVVVPVGGRVS